MSAPEGNPIDPGDTQLTRIPSRASSMAIDFMNRMSPAFAAQYAERYG